MLNNLKIAHLVTDEKFPDSAWDLFEGVAPGCNDFFIVSKPTPLKYIKKTPVEFVNYDSYKSKKFMKRLESYDFVVLHGLTFFNQQLVAYTKDSNIKYVWIGLGYDYYDIIYDHFEELLLPKTHQMYKKDHTSRLEAKTILYKLKQLKNKIIFKLKNILKYKYKSDSKQSIISRIDFFSPVLVMEYDLVKNKFMNINKFPEYIHWNYGSNARLINDLEAPVINRNAKGILLGNSATYTNNHIEMLEFLKEQKDKFENIICPLSYGDMIYAKNIEMIGEKYFADSFFPLREFMSYDKYLLTMSSVPVVIMNHKRQQAGGNIGMMLFKGATVFLREENPLYMYYKNMGVLLFSIQNLKQNPNLLNYRLSNEEVLHTRLKFKQFGGLDVAKDRTESLIRKVIGL